MGYRYGTNSFVSGKFWEVIPNFATINCQKCFLNVLAVNNKETIRLNSKHYTLILAQISQQKIEVYAFCKNLSSTPIPVVECLDEWMNEWMYEML